MQVELKVMAARIKSLRVALYEALQTVDAPGDWSHIVKQIGMFSYTGLTPRQCQRMTDKWHIYLPLNGRISMAGLSFASVGYMAEAIKDTVNTCT